MIGFFLFIISIILIIIADIIAYRKNRSILGWTFASILITPIISILILLILKKDEVQEKIS